MKSNNLIYHIYYGTQGTAGLYMDEIYQTLEKSGFSQKAFVSAYYPFNYGEKIYFKHSDIIHGVKNRRCRLLIRYLELICAMILLFVRTLVQRPKIINYSLLSVLYVPEKLYLRAVKILGFSKIMFTCHDVIPFGQVNESILNHRKQILGMSDYYLVHNESSKKELMNTVGIAEERIKIHSFPIMDLRKMKFELKEDKKYDFLFQGVLREEKGLDVLLDAWMRFHENYPEAKLLIAGYGSKDSIDWQKYSNVNICFDLQYLNDYQYCKNIASSRCMVLPYKRGTNSGIPSSSISLGCEVIASDIPMFKNNNLILSSYLFDSENIEDLYKVLTFQYENKCQPSFIERIEEYRKVFNLEIICVYNSLLW